MQQAKLSYAASKTLLFSKQNLAMQQANLSYAASKP